MQNVFIQKLKNILLFILKSAIMLSICIPLIFVFLIISMFVSNAYSSLFKTLGMQMNTWYPTGITTQILQIMVFYFISKQLGIIKTFDKLPYWALLPIVFVYEFTFVYFPAVGSGHILDYPVYYIKKMIILSFQGNGYLYTFLTYSLIRLLNKKYPKVLKKFIKKKN